jgi:hypothetical protein
MARARLDDAGESAGGIAPGPIAFIPFHGDGIISQFEGYGLPAVQRRAEPR